MAEVEMTPVEMTPIAPEPPKANPLGSPTAVRKPVIGAGIKLPPKPTVATAGLKLPPKPVIRKPGASPMAKPLPKPLPKPIAPAVAKPAPAVVKDAAAKPNTATPMEQLKEVTQKLKGVTQEIPQQAILHKTGIIADGAIGDVQKEAAKHKTARISLADAIGVAPVKESSPMKTIRIQRPASLAANAEAKAAGGGDAAPSITQRKTLKIARPGAAIRPTGKFGATAQKPAETQAAAPASDGSEVADIADIPDMPAPRVPVKNVDTTPQWVVALSTAVGVAACIAIGALAFFLYQNSQTIYF